MTEANDSGIAADYHAWFRDGGRELWQLTMEYRGVLHEWDVVRIEAPRVATIVGPGASSLSAGESWHHFETKLDYPLSRVGALDELDLDNLDVVILPSGWYRMGEEKRSALADWVRGGGQLVAVGGACSAFAGQDGWGLERYAEGARAEIEAAEAAVQEAADERNAHDRSAQGLDPLPFTDRGRDRLRYDLPGAIFQAAVDDSHPLADGYGTEYMTLRTSGRRYAALEAGKAEHAAHS